MAAKGLYGVSNLADSDRQRGAFYGAGGLGRMQGLLANASISNRVHRKVASLFGDLALRGEVSTQSALLHLIGLQPAEHVSHMKGWSRLLRTCLSKLLPSRQHQAHSNTSGATACMAASSHLAMGESPVLYGPMLMLQESLHRKVKLRGKGMHLCGRTEQGPRSRL